MKYHVPFGNKRLSDGWDHINAILLARVFTGRNVLGDNSMSLLMFRLYSHYSGMKHEANLKCTEDTDKYGRIT